MVQRDRSLRSISSAVGKGLADFIPSAGCPMMRLKTFLRRANSAEVGTYGLRTESTSAAIEVPSGGVRHREIDLLEGRVFLEDLGLGHPRA
jgi:hypothetical protein